MITPIILLFCFASLLPFLRLSQKSAKILWVLMSVLLFLLAAFRNGEAVYDYANYVAMYRNTLKVSTEISFSLIAWIVQHVLFNNVLFLFAIFAALGVALKVKAINTLTTLGFLSLVIYISHFYILHELTQIRAGVAGGFLLLCIKPICERNFRLFLLFAACAVFFHYSALLIFLLWFLRNDSINKYVYAAIIPLSYIVYFLDINLVELCIQHIPIEHIQQKYATYALFKKINPVGHGSINVFNYVFLAKCSVYYVLLWKSNFVKMQNKYVNSLLKIQALSLTSFILFSAMPVFAFRISELLGVVEIILIPLIYYVFKPKLLSTAVVVLVGLSMLLINIYYVHLIIF